jgi:hypothetical protein
MSSSSSPVPPPLLLLLLLPLVAASLNLVGVRTSTSLSDSLVCSILGRLHGDPNSIGVLLLILCAVMLLLLPAYLLKRHVSCRCAAVALI